MSESRDLFLKTYEAAGWCVVSQDWVSDRLRCANPSGMTIKMNTDHGPRDVRVIKVGRYNVDVDTNHPLAGLALSFDIEIVDVRDATPEELQHRHVHGAGGHHH